MKTVMQRKVLAEDIELGMYVARLDRAWEQSPFLFQGFVVSTREELAQLRELCKFVFVDEDLSEYEDRTLHRSVEVKPKGSVRATRTEWSKITEKEQKLTFETEIRKEELTDELDRRDAELDEQDAPLIRLVQG